MPPKQRFRGIREYTKEDYAAARGIRREGSSNSKRKRQREVTACKPCRVRKISCDRSEPCATCQKRGRVLLCTYDHDAEADETLRSIGPHSGKGRKDEAVDNPQSRPVQNDMRDERRTVYWGSHHWKQPIIDDMKWLATSNHLLEPQMAELASLRAHFVPDRRRTLWNATSIDTTYTRVAIELRLPELLPPADVCRVMVSRYLATLHRIYPIVDAQVLEHYPHAKHTDRTDSSSTLEMTVLYLAIVSLGHQLPALYDEDPGSQRPKRRDGKALMASLRPLILSLVQQARHPTVDIFQSLICLVLQEKLDLDWVDGNSSMAGLLALLGRMLLSLGLHRDPRYQGNISGEVDMRIRRNLFWSLAMLDFEHAVYSGQPCIFPFQSSDVEVPSSIDAGDWLPRAATYMPQLATGIHGFHDSKSQPVLPSTTRPSHIRPDPDDPVDFPVNFTQDFVAVMGSAFCKCLNNHLKLAADLTVTDSDSDSQASGLNARDLILERLSENLSELKGVTHVLDSMPAKSKSTWSLLVSSLLRCPIAYTCSVTFIMAMRATSSPDIRTRNTTDELVRDAKTVHKLLEGGLPLSYDNLKHFVLFQMQLRTMDERAALANEQAKSGHGDIPDDGLIVLATQQATEFGIRIARVALERACNMDDPPPNLIVAAPVEQHSTDKTVQNPNMENIAQDTNPDLSCPPNITNLFGQSDWAALFDDWLVEPGAFPND